MLRWRHCRKQPAFPVQEAGLIRSGTRTYEVFTVWSELGVNQPVKQNAFGLVAKVVAAEFGGSLLLSKR